MQQYIGAFLVAACLLEPQVVQSKEIYSLDQIAALAPTIDHLVDSTRFASRRSLQADSVFAEFGVDDDVTLNFLAEIEADLDPDLVQCVVETNTFTESLGEDVEIYVEAVMADISMDTDFDFAANTASVVMEYGEESRELLKEMCAGVGGRFEMIADISCFAVDPESGMEISMAMSGFSTCLADVPACKPGVISSYMSLVLQATGQECSIDGPPAAALPEPEPEPEPEPASEPEETDEESSEAAESGATSGLQVGFLALTGILSAASIFL